MSLKYIFNLYYFSSFENQIGNEYILHKIILLIMNHKKCNPEMKRDTSHISVVKDGEYKYRVGEIYIAILSILYTTLMDWFLSN